jgi:hypothetical protein
MGWTRRALRSAALAEEQAQKTFSEVAAQYIAKQAKSWKNAKHQAQWRYRAAVSCSTIARINRGRS